MNQTAPRGPRARLGEKDDAELVAISRRQLPHVTLAYEVLMRRHQAALARTCTRYLGSVHDAEEVVHEVMLRVFHGLPKFKGESSFRTWLYRIAYNESMNYLRKRRDTQALDGVDESAYLATEPHTLEQRVMAQRLDRSLARLNPQDRTIVVYRAIAELEFREIADILELNLSTVKMRYQRALEKLKPLYD
ncbi:MAG: sigma-70 family RNA polymerase sigma factor [Pseudomonadota bacterium]|nr:RNA polymerase subunit sigma [Pseudomonadales bacterium]MDY6922068.1 sigma-70 family RNA polymerase sigma factor [Pseudomonadota bacterium]